MIVVYNTMTRSKEPFQPVNPPRVGIYLCGPTVYAPSHVGHMVGPVIFDTIKRYLVYNGYEVTWVVNITDVDDKLIIRAREEGTTVEELAGRITGDYLACLRALGVDGIDHMPRATEHIGDIVAIAQGLIAKGCAYVSEGDVYFDVTRAPGYGKLSRRAPEELREATRAGTSAPKRDPGDFALWKASKPGEPSWPSPWGPGRPGWHIECSAMSMKLLGEHFDIHGGGLDLIFPHHENEVAQSECHTGQPFANVWMHTGLLTREGKKISKSDPETPVTMRQLLDAHDPDTLRSLYLLGHYRRPIDYGPSRLAEISRSLDAFRHFLARFEGAANEDFEKLPAPASRADGDAAAAPQEFVDHRRRFLAAMDDDFNTGRAIGVLFDLLRDLNRLMDRRTSDLEGDAGWPTRLLSGAVILKELTQILGLFRPHGRTTDTVRRDDYRDVQLIDLLIHVRARARAGGDFRTADTIREGLTRLGVLLDDRPGGTSWRWHRS